MSIIAKALGKALGPLLKGGGKLINKAAPHLKNAAIKTADRADLAIRGTKAATRHVAGFALEGIVRSGYAVNRAVAGAARVPENTIARLKGNEVAKRVKDITPIFKSKELIMYEPELPIDEIDAAFAAYGNKFDIRVFDKLKIPVEKSARHNAYRMTKDVQARAKKGDKFAAHMLKNYQDDIRNGTRDGVSVDFRNLEDDIPIRATKEGTIARALADVFAELTPERLSIRASKVGADQFARAAVSRVFRAISDSTTDIRGYWLNAKNRASIEATIIRFENDLNAAHQNMGDLLQGSLAERGLKESGAKTAAIFSKKAFEGDVVNVLRGGSSEDKWVNSAAMPYREYFKKVKMNSERIGMDMGDIQDYFPIIHDMTAIRANPTGHIEAIAEVLTLLSKESDKPIKDVVGLAEIIHREIRTKPDGFMMNSTKKVITSGRLKGRVFDFGKHANVLKDFLIDDLLEVTRAYNRNVVGQMKSHELFGKNGFDGVIKKINKMFDDAAKEAPDMADKINKNRAAAISDLDLLYKKTLTGSTFLPGSAHDVAMFLSKGASNAMDTVMLGKVAVSSIGDLASDFAHSLIGRSNLGMIRSVFTDMDTMPKKDLQRILGWTEVVNNHNIFNRFGEQPFVGAGHLAETGPLTKAANIGLDISSAMSGATAKWSGLSAFDNGARIATSMNAIDRVLVRVNKIVKGTISPDEAAKMAKLGIGKEEAKAIANNAQFAEFDKAKQRWYPNLEFWDQRVAEIFDIAVRRSADEVSLRPGIANSPFWMGTPLGKVLLKFQPFAFAQFDRVGRHVLSKKKSETLGFIASSLYISMVSLYAKDLIAGRKPSSNPADWLYEAVHHSGLLGWTMNLVTAADRTGFGPASLFGLEAGTKYYERQNPAGGLVGPSFSFIQMMNNAMNRKDWNSISRMIPFLNLAQLQGAVTMAKQMKLFQDNDLKNNGGFRPRRRSGGGSRRETPTARSTGRPEGR